MSRRNHHSRELKFEPMEPRQLLATLTVDSLLDTWDPAVPSSQDGVVTLREAIAAANENSPVGDLNIGGSGDDVIVFDPSLTRTRS